MNHPVSLSVDTDDFSVPQNFNVIHSLENFLQSDENINSNSSVITLSFLTHALSLELLYSNEVNLSFQSNRASIASSAATTLPPPQTMFYFGNICIDNFTYHNVRQNYSPDSLIERSFQNLGINPASPTSTSNSTCTLTTRNDVYIELLAATRFLNYNSKVLIEEYNRMETQTTTTNRGRQTIKFRENCSLSFYDNIYYNTSRIDFNLGNCIPTVSIINKYLLHNTSAMRGHKVASELLGEKLENIATYLDARPYSGMIIRELSQNKCSVALASLDVNDQTKLIAITNLFFICQGAKNPAVFLHHQMILDLILYRGMTWEDAIIDFMPMSVKDATMKSRAVNEWYRLFMPIPYEYDHKTTVISNVSDEDRLELIGREGKIVERWFHKIVRKPEALENRKLILKILKRAIRGWYGVELSVNPVTGGGGGGGGGVTTLATSTATTTTLTSPSTPTSSSSSHHGFELQRSASERKKKGTTTTPFSS